MGVIQRVTRGWHSRFRRAAPRGLPAGVPAPRAEGAGLHIGPYRVTAAMGPWRHGWLYRAYDGRLGGEVILKTMSLRAAQFPEFVDRFLHEARLTSCLNHPGVIALYDLGEADATMFMAYEPLVGERLTDALQRGLGLNRAVPVVLQLLEALAAIHRAGVIHRDLTPDAVFVCAGGFAKIVELEVAAPSQGRRTGSAPVHNSPFYIAPEQLRHQDVDPRCDLFSLGCILYEMVTGRVPFTGSSVSEVSRAILTNEPDWEALPSGTAWQPMREVIRRALEKDPEDRFPDAEAMRSALATAHVPLRESASWTPPSHSIPVLTPD